MSRSYIVAASLACTAMAYSAAVAQISNPVPVTSAPMFGAAESSPRHVVIDMQTGEILPQGGAPRASVAVFDNYENLNSPQLVNVSYADCDCYANPGCSGPPGGTPSDAWLYPMSSTIGAQWEAPSGATPPTGPSDALWDEYFVDLGAWPGPGGPGDMFKVLQLELIPILVNFTGGPEDQALVIRFFSVDGVEDFGGVIVEYPGHTTAGWFEEFIDISGANIPIEDQGLIVYDWVNNGPQGDDGVGMMIAGGDLLDFNCPAPSSLWTLGETNPESWFSSDMLTDVDPGYDCDPNQPQHPGLPAGVSYRDAANTGALLNVAWVDNVLNPTSELAHDFPKRIWIEDSANAPTPAPGCVGAGGCAGDLDNDGDTDLADLGILLADFGCTAPGPCPGDLDNDGDTDLADLGILLADFGCLP